MRKLVRLRNSEIFSLVRNHYDGDEENFYCWLIKKDVSNRNQGLFIQFIQYEIFICLIIISKIYNNDISYNIFIIMCNRVCNVIGNFVLECYT